MGIRAAFDACVNQLVKVKDWFKRVKNAVLSTLAIKLGSHVMEGYSQQLIEIETRIRELNDALPPGKEIEKVEILTETAKTTNKKDLRELSAFISSISKEDKEMITILAEATKEFKVQDPRSLTRFIKKFSKEGLEKITSLIEKRVLDKVKIDLSGEIDQKIQQIIPDILEIISRGISSSDKEKLKNELEYLKLTLGVGELLPDFDRLEFDEEKQAKRVKRGRVADALEDLWVKDVTAQWKKIDEMRFVMGIILLKSGDYEKAYKIFDNITKINPKLKKVWMNKGIAAGGMRDHEEEIHCYDEALKIDKYLFCWDSVPGSDSDRLIKFLKEDFSINWAEKEDINKKNNDIQVSNGENFVNVKLNENMEKATLEISDGRTQELKIKQMHDKLTVYTDENYALAFYNKAISLKEARKYKEAEQNFEKAYKIDPRLPEVRNREVFNRDE
jgi:tetratricopeptide (TPR) repeat protein